MSPARYRPPQRPYFTWRLRTRALELGERTLVMAIVNVTPDSFSGDGLLAAGNRADGMVAGATLMKLAVARAVEAVDAGAEIVDLGAESTRPGAIPLGPAEEQARLMPVLAGLLQERPQAVVSVDTYHAATARLAAKAGAEIINDVSGMTWDDEMASVVARAGCGLVLMHTRGRPGEWREQQPLLEEVIVPETFRGLCEGVATAEAAGIATERIVVDPGFGFGKRGDENFTLLAGLGRLHELGRPMLVGLSRKSFLGGEVGSRGVATVAANTAAVLAGAHVLRVHDVRAAREAVTVADAVLRAGSRK